MLVPFMRFVPLSVNCGTLVMAPPGAQTHTPLSPSIVGPLELQVKGVPGSFSLVEYIAVIISGLTYAPTPITALVHISGGAPTVQRAGPSLPALATHVTPCLLITSLMRSPTLPSLLQ